MLSPTNSNPQVVPHGTELIEIKGDSNQDPTALIKQFKSDKNIRLVLALSGGADDGADIEQIRKTVRAILKPLYGFAIAVLTGGTTGELPLTGLQVARELHFPTIGVFPLRAQKDQDLGLMNLAVCVHPPFGESQWGDESPAFTKLLDAVVVYGGKSGTMIEMTHLLKMNEKKAGMLWEIDECQDTLDDPEATGEQKAAAEARIAEIRAKLPQHKLRHIIPLYGTGGVANVLPFFPGKATTMAKSMPSHLITSAKQVVPYMIRNDVITENEF